MCTHTPKTKEINGEPVCHGCHLRWKDVGISGETVAGHTLGEKPHILSDTAKDQRIEGANQIAALSKRMQAGGAVAEDNLQQPIQTQYARVNDASRADNINPIYKNTLTGR